MGDDAVAHRLGQVQALAVALERVDDPQRMLVMLERQAEPLGQAAVEHVLADVPERRVAEVVAEPDRLDQVLVQAQRAGHRSRDLRDLERVREARPVMIARRRDEHLRLVLQAPERLAVDDPVAVALKRRAQTAVGLLGTCTAGRIRARRASGERSRSSRARIRAANAVGDGPPECSYPVVSDCSP